MTGSIHHGVMKLGPDPVSCNPWDWSHIPRCARLKLYRGTGSKIPTVLINLYFGYTVYSIFSSIHGRGVDSGGQLVAAAAVSTAAAGL